MKRKVVVSGLHFPLTMMSYFIRALERRDDVELITVGPYTGTWIPWNGGLEIPRKYVHTPTIPLPSDASQIKGAPPSYIEAQLPWKPDLWLQIDAGWWLQRPKAEVVAHVATDPHVLDYSVQRGGCDYFFNMQRAYMQKGDILLPYAFDPTCHYPMDVEKEFDGCLVGLQYQNRTSLVQALRNEGYNIEYSIGSVYDEFNLLYNKSRIALNWSSLLDLNARTFEAMGMGIPLLTNYIPALDEFFEEGEHYLEFNTVEEAVANFRGWIDEPDYASYVAENAYNLVKKSHTWDRRIQQIFDTVFE
jgi:hypothetical protein